MCTGKGEDYDFRHYGFSWLSVKNHKDPTLKIVWLFLFSNVNLENTSFLFPTAESIIVIVLLLYLV